MGIIDAYAKPALPAKRAKPAKPKRKAPHAPANLGKWLHPKRKGR